MRALILGLIPSLSKDEAVELTRCVSKG